MTKSSAKTNTINRPPIVTVMGHIDHGKSTLLDYIRKTNITENEEGGITQYLSAYEASHTTNEGVTKKITFLDTPGHVAFSSMRSRGAKAADIAVLVVSAEDGVKEQTMEAYKCIKEANIPFVVAITKIDKPGANIERTKNSLAEKGIYLEGLGGNISCVPLSSKTGEGVGELLDIVLLQAELEDLKGEEDKPAEGYVLESHLDPKRGTSATLIITNGTLKHGMYITTGKAMAPARIIENFLGQTVDKLSFSSPARITGFSELPSTGALFQSYANREDAKKAINNLSTVHGKSFSSNSRQDSSPADKLVIPIVVKADVLGTAEAVVGQIEQMRSEESSILPKIVYTGVGAVGENDIQLVGGNAKAIILGFNVKIEQGALTKANREGISIASFKIIYELVDWLKKELEKRAPKKTVEETKGVAKILRSFSRAKDKQVIGGEVTQGTLRKGDNFKIIRRDAEIGRGKIIGLQQQKIVSDKVEAPNQFGMQAECKVEIAPGDRVETYELTTK